MLKNLIERLGEVECKLVKIKNEGSMAECCLPHERYRSLTNMVKILSSLVKRTIHDKHSEDDIALCCEESGTIEDEPALPNISSSEEFLTEVKHLLKSKPESDSEFYIYLSNFQQLLGELVFSICEISNFKNTLASGITVRDLVTIKTFYSTLWELLSSKNSNSSMWNIATKQERKQTEDQQSKVTSVISDLVNTLGSCLKEMSKVKLDIEHYFKFNLIEMQFTKSENEVELKSGVEDNVKINEHTQYMKSEDYDPNKQNDSKGFHQDFSTSGGKKPFTRYNMPPPQSGGNLFSSCIFPQNIGWENSQDYGFAKDPYENLFNEPVIYPPDVLFFEPQTIVFKSQVEPTKKKSLPKIYSIESINDDDCKLPNSGNSDGSCNDKGQTKTIPQNDCGDKKGNLIKDLLLEKVDEDLFSDNANGKSNEKEYVQLKEKISSLFTLLKTNQMSHTDDIFDTDPFEMKENSLSLQKPKENKVETQNKKRKIVKSKNFSRNLTVQVQNENADKQRVDAKINKSKKLVLKKLLKKEKCKGLLQQERLYIDQMEFWAPKEKEVLYDRQSVIELFKSNPTECFNAGSVPTQESNFCLWPVAAEYIYVSRGEGSETCDSDQNENSILLNSNYKKSLYTLQMNKRYEQKQLYEGNLIVIGQAETDLLRNKRNSTFSLSNQSTDPYDEYETIENEDTKHLYPYEKKNKRVSFNNPLVPNEHGGFPAQHRSYAVHYADCADSFKVGNNCRKEKINYFNFNSYNDPHNWDSFISIMTSKVGPNTQINEQRMFRKIVTNLGPESSRNNNLFGNVHTLTSNGGPFRLFDINGYPITDSEGNVLKDPYGKCLVDLDSTGLPKHDVKVFDAAGNSPKDVKFDPTQKPQTNCVVVKLTDNFKRPLHLFDKYGRPLTDSCGKLLVNIHGRPLLRFDNFGRPNTDYRGGPLYTDNGFRWSFKTQSISKEHISEETLTSQKGNNESTGDTSIQTDTTDEIPKFRGDAGEPDRTKVDKSGHVKTRNSDIWLQVESVLLQHSKRNQVEPRPSQTKVLVNSFTVNQNPEIKKIMESIIYHDNGQCAFQSGTNNCQPEESNKEQGECKVKDGGEQRESNTFLDGNVINCNKQKDILNAIMNANFPLPFYENTSGKDTALGKVANTKIQELNPYLKSIFLEKNHFCKDPRLLVQDNILRKNLLMDISMGHASGVTNMVPPTFNFNQEYLNNLCNKILKNKVESRIILKQKHPTIHELHHAIGGKKGTLTDATFSDFTCSSASKYTNDIPLYTDSPAVSVEYQKNDPQIKKILEDIDSKFRKNNKPKDEYHQTDHLKDQSDVRVTIGDKNKTRYSSQKADKFKGQSYKEYSKEILKSSGTSEETNTYVDIVSNGSNQYQINVKERMRTGFQSRGDNYVVETDSNYVCETFDTQYPERDNDVIKHNMSISGIQPISQPINHSTDVYHGEFCRHFKNEKYKAKDSLFRYPSKEKMEATTTTNKTVDYANGNHHHPIKHAHYYPKTVKNHQRDCNLVSFLGTPVKYVLNKLDTKLSLRQEGKEKKHLKTINEQQEKEKKVKTLYSKGNKKYVTSTETNERKRETNERKRDQRHSNKKANLLAFKSKSFSEMQFSKMSYSGSQDTSGKYSPESSSQYNKCSSDTVVVSRHKHTHSPRKSRRYDTRKPRKEQYSFETHYVHTSSTANHHHRIDKSPKAYDKHTSKSPKNTAKTAKLFKKAGHSSKQKRFR